MSDDSAIDTLAAAAEPAAPRPLAGALDRLAAYGLLLSADGDAAQDAADAGAETALRGLAVRGLTEDSRAVRPGTLFAAIPGFHVDGHRFVAAAEAAGAVAALVERRVDGVTIPQVVVADARAALARCAGWWYGDPSRELGVIGITGTDGKTTTAFLAVAALEAAGLSMGLVGTVDTKVGSVRERHEAHVTTPSAPELGALLRAMVAGGNDAAVLETTSHALALDRVLGIAYDAAVFTNLTHEHLELHGTFEAYRDAKLRLFERVGPGPDNPAKTVAGRPWPRVAIVNADDPSAPFFAGAARTAGARVIAYGQDPGADVRLTGVDEDRRRLLVRYEAPSGAASLSLRLAGRFNAANALAVVALAEGLGLDPAAVRAGLEGVAGVPGRMERIDAGQPFGVVVDYAHSPASLQTVLDLLGPLATAGGGSLIAVFGSAGERDTTKRAVMGRVAGERCRIVVATDEDPRGEDRHAILESIVTGAEAAGRRRGTDVLAIADRREAIAAAFDRARPGDIVLLAGKGHEPSILYADGPVPWDEAAAARAALAERGFGGR